MNTNRELFGKYIAQTTDFVPMQLEIEKAQGIYLYDVSGKEYIDFISGIAVSNIGHRHPEVVKAIKDQLDKYLHVMVYGEYIQSPQVRLAKILNDLLPEGLDCTYFVNSGSETIDGALKLARLFTSRTEIISFKNAYHGSTLGAMSIMGTETYKQTFRPLIPDIKILEFNNLSCLDKITEKTACVVVEPIQAAAGIIMPNIEFLKILREKCTETGTLLIFDEIQTGFGRTGTLFAFQQFDIQPDILCVAKGMGAGMPIAAFISSFKIMESLNSGHPLCGHATTFGGHPISCVSALAGLEVLHKEKLMEKVKKKSDLFRELLKHPAVREIRGLGFMMAVDLGSSERVRKVVEESIKRGLLINWFLFNNKSINIAPPLIITEDEIIKACEILLDVLGD
jgi:acetylornithine/succinyldiaminopimelate/putrescine aminotransferase